MRKDDHYKLITIYMMSVIMLIVVMLMCAFAR